MILHALAMSEWYPCILAVRYVILLMGWLTTIVVWLSFIILLIWCPLAPISSDTIPYGTKIMMEKASFFVLLNAW